MNNPSPRKTLRLKVTLRGIRPQIWRRILVSDAATLQDLHQIIQAAFGWLECHLHEFEIAGASYGDVAIDDYGELDLQDERAARLRDFRLQKGRSFLYRYDFGDGWEHSVLVEEVLPHERGAQLPQCVGGKRSAPPEDVGGVGGYARFLDAISNPADEEHEQYLHWVGGSFNSELFDLDAADRRLRTRMAPRWGGDRPTFAADAGDEPAEGFLVPAPAEPLGQEHEPTCAVLPLRRDIVTVLEYLRDNKVVGTQSTGNFPRKDVQAIAARFCDPPLLEERIGDHVFRFQSEDDVRSLFMVHNFANGARLIDGGPARRWRLTPAGQEFLLASATEQTWALFAAWWYRMNWLIADPFASADDELPEEFSRAVLQNLRSAPDGSSIDRGAFSESALKATGWKRTSETPPATWDRLMRMVIWTVVEPLETLGLLAGERKTVERSWGESEELVSFIVTPLGRSFLRSVV